MSEKPPIGLKPRFIHDASRLKEITEACSRFMEASYPIPTEWIDEYNEIVGRMRSGDYTILPGIKSENIAELIKEGQMS